MSDQTDDASNNDFDHAIDDEYVYSSINLMKPLIFDDLPFKGL